MRSTADKSPSVPPPPEDSRSKLHVVEDDQDDGDMGLSNKPPGIRAAWCKGIVRAMERLPPVERERVAAQIPDAVRETVERSSRVGWIDAETHCALMDHIMQALGGEDEFRAFYRDVADTNFRGALLADIVKRGFRNFGRRIMVRLFARGWNMVLRGYGKPMVEQTDDETMTTVTFVDVPKVVRDSVAYRVSVAAVFESGFERFGITGSVELDASEVEHGRLIYVLRDESGA